MPEALATPAAGKSMYWPSISRHTPIQVKTEQKASASLCRAEEQQGKAAGRAAKEKGAERRAGKSEPPAETLGSVLESAKQAVSGAAPGSSLSHALEKLHGNIAQLSATDQFAAHMAIGSLLTTK